MNVAIVGLWHQGIVGAACLAGFGYSVTAADRDAEKIATLRGKRSPIFEPDLDDLIGEQVTAGRLSFTTDLAGAVKDADYVLLMQDTPVDADDRSDLSGVMADVDTIAPALADDVTLYVTAQVPVGTCHAIRDRIAAARPGLSFGIGYSPENLRLGQAIERFRSPPLPVIGADDDVSAERIETLMAPCGVEWKRVSLRTAEMSKHALNAYLALSITFANELGNLCDEVGADGFALADILRLEPRVGKKAMLYPGLGFSGGTLARDMQTLRGLGDRFGIETPLLDGGWSSNKVQNGLVLRKLTTYFGGSVRGRKVAVLGLTYKPGTSTLRRSASLEVIFDLEKEGAVVRATDPKADRAELAELEGFDFFDNAADAIRGAEAVVLMTPWNEYRDLNWSDLASAMTGRAVLDTANLWDGNDVESADLVYMNIGRGRVVRAKGA